MNKILREAEDFFQYNLCHIWWLFEVQTSSFGYPDPSLLIFTSSYIAPGFPPLAPDLGWGLIMVWVLIHEWRDEIPSRIPWASSPWPSFPAPLVLFFGAFPPAFAPFYTIWVFEILKREKIIKKNENKTCKDMYMICYTIYTQTFETKRQWVQFVYFIEARYL